MSEEPKKPEDLFRSSIKSFVAISNGALEKLQKASSPALQSLEQAKTQSDAVVIAASDLYQRRHEYPVEIISSAAVLGGSILMLRRGRIAGLLGAATFGGAAYAVVYDELDLSKVYRNTFEK